MDIDKLVYQLKCEDPDLYVISQALEECPELINGIIHDHASPLHLAIRNDVIFGNNLTAFLINEFRANPNIQNESGSIPLFWGLAACEELKALGKKPFWNSIQLIIRHPAFKLKKKLQNRGRVIDFLMKFYNSVEVKDIIEDRLWKNRQGLVYLRETVRSCPLV